MDFDILFAFSGLLIASVIIMDVWMGLGMLTGKRSKKVNATKISLDETTVKPQSSTMMRLNQASDFVWKFRLIIIHVLFLGVALYVLHAGFSPIPSIQDSYPQANQNWNDYSVPITVIFTEPVEISHLKPTVSDENLKGNWVYEKYLGFLPLTRVAKFYPSNTLLPNQRLVVYMAGMSRMGVVEENEGALNFFTQKEPEVDYVQPQDLSTEVDTSTDITYKLTSPNMPYDKWEFEITPQADFTVSSPDTSTFVIHPTNPLEQSTAYTISAFRTAIVYDTSTLKEISHDNRLLVHKLTFTTRKAPLVKLFTPTGTGVKEDATIKIVFDLAMNKDMVQSMWQLSPAVDGSFAWTDDHTLVFTPTAKLPKETQYTLTLPKGLQSQTGGVTERAITYTFTTIGAIRVNSFSPGNGSVRISRMGQIRVNFDQAVDHNSAMSHFGITPTAHGDITWDGNNLIFTPNSPLAFNTTYTIAVGTGIKSIDGLDSRQDFKSTFTTVPNQTLIAGFSIDLQDYDFTCGVAAAKMMLAWKGINTSEETLVGLMGEDTSPWLASGGTHTWGDPNRAFLGYKGVRTDGGGGQGSGWIPGPGQSNTEPAYGALWNPIIKAYQSYGIQTELHRNWDVVSLAHAIEAGHPVQIWWYNGVSYGPNGQLGEYMTWQDNVTGQTITALEGMHSIDVIGFNGDPDNPTSFIVMDPWWGYQTYSLSKFNWQWPFLSNTGLIIY